MPTTAKPKQASINVTISPPNFQTIEVIVVGTAPLVIERFSGKAAMMLKMANGPSAEKAPRTARDFENDAERAKHISEDGWEGFNAAALRAACISACRLVNFKMTIGKLSIFVVGDGLGKEDGDSLIRIYGKSETFTKHTRNATGVIDVRSRPMYRRWAARLRMQYDADQFKAADTLNLISRVGMQVGIGAGRPDSKDSAGQGWGTFRVVSSTEEAQVRKQFGIEAA